MIKIYCDERRLKGVGLGISGSYKSDQFSNSTTANGAYVRRQDWPRWNSTADWSEIQITSVRW